jgi:CubicO group peptidase (beta-lactamase class C family)
VTDLSPLEPWLERGVKDAVFGAAVAGVGRSDGTEWLAAAGKTRSDGRGEPVTGQTLFDLASLTKVLATTGITARMIERKELSLDDRIGERLPALPWHVDWSEVTIRDVLAHRAGFTPWVDLSGDARHGRPIDREILFGRIASMPTFYPPRSSTLYSDLGFIILGALLEKVSGVSMDRLVEQEIRKPIGCHSLAANPLTHGVALSNIAATEDVPWRGGVIHGSVHDDNAFVLGGLAGHAGLFGTVGDCLEVGAAWRDSLLGRSGFLGKEVAEEFTTRVLTDHGFARALGWDVPSSPASAAGAGASPRTIGHLGFTGTSIWIDPVRDAVVVLLTNRVHPTSKNENIKQFRPGFHDAVWEALQ